MFRTIFPRRIKMSQSFVVVKEEAVSGDEELTKGEGETVATTTGARVRRRSRHRQWWRRW